MLNDKLFPHQPCAEYVVGLMFSNDHSRLALIRKQKPDWQRGKLNGVGGKVETKDDTYRDAMVREFLEETGYQTTADQWEKFLEMDGKANDGGEGGFCIVFFATVGDVSLLKSTETEQIEVVYTDEIRPLRRDVVENLPWIVALAIDYLNDRRPQLVIARYP